MRRGKEEDEEKENVWVLLLLVWLLLLSAKVSDVGDRESCEDDARLSNDPGPVLGAAESALAVVVVVVADDDEEGWNMARMGHSRNQSVPWSFQTEDRTRPEGG